MNFQKTESYLFHSRLFQNFGSKSYRKKWLETELGKIGGFIWANMISSGNFITDYFICREVLLLIINNLTSSTKHKICLKKQHSLDSALWVILWRDF
jgi:hypothetical protein